MCYVNGKLNIIKKQILAKLIYRFKKILIKTLTEFFLDSKNFILKFIYQYKGKETGIAKTILSKQNKVGGWMLPDFKISCKATVTEIVSYWQKDRHVGPWSRIESSETDPLKYSQLIFSNDAKAIQQRKNSHPAINKEMNLDIIHFIQKLTPNRL